MSGTLRRSAERAALAFDEFIGFGAGLASDLAEQRRDRVKSEELILQLQMVRRYAIGVINSACPCDAERLIHLPEMPEVGLLHFESPLPDPSPDTLWDRPRDDEPGHSPGVTELVPADSVTPGLV